MSNVSVGSHHRRRQIRTIVAITVGVLVAGYVSSVTSRGRCESMTVERVVRELGTKDVFVLTLEGFSSPVGYPGSDEILRNSGFNAIPCDLSRTRAICLPWVGVARAGLPYPFIVDIQWTYVGKSIRRAGTRSRYLTFFGAARLLMDTAASPFVV